MYLEAFIFVGLVCLIGELILSLTKLTPGHITSMFVVLGSILSFTGIYQKFFYHFGASACIPIMSFGNSLFTSSYNGFLKDGFLGLLSNLLVTTSAGISATVIFSFLLLLFFKPKN